MKRPLKSSVLRTLIPVVFILLTVAGTIWHTGWGTLSSFGWKEIAAVCPLGALETMLAEKTILPRALAALVVFFVIAVVLGRVLCGWICPVPVVSKFLNFIKTGGRKAQTVSVKPVMFVAKGESIPTQTAAQPAAEKKSACETCGACAASEAVKEKLEEKKAIGNAGPLTVLAGALASSAVFGFPVFCLVCPVGLTFALVIALSRLFQFNESGWAVVIFATFLIVELLVLRRWCRNFCPIGALVSLMTRLNRTFVPRINPKACVHATHGVDCRICADACPEGIDLRKPDLTAEELSHCTKCRACAEACPSQAIRFPLFKSTPHDDAKPAPERGQAVVVPAQTRKSNYAEAKETISIEQAISQSTRCLRCGRCTSICPQGNAVSRWMALLSRDDVKGAAALMLEAGRMPEICGRICPFERLCEQVCSMTEAQGAVMIPDIERAVSEYALAQGWHPKIRRARRSAHVAVIGAGPAGLACADYLARRGVFVTVYEKNAQAGGLLTYGIPPFKLARDVMARRRAVSESLGIKFVTGVEVGKSVSLEEIRGANDALFVATGAEAAVAPRFEGADLPGVMPAMALLGAVSRRELGEAFEMPQIKGKRVVVLGAGDTAVDCLRCAVREGAVSVTAVARKPREALRASPTELRYAEEEGAVVRTQLEVERIASAEGNVAAVICRNSEGGIEEIPADIVLVAYGFKPQPAEWLTKAGVEFDESGKVKVDAENASSVAGLYAGGDAVRGSSLVSAAVADGRNAAEAILHRCGIA